MKTVAARIYSAIKQQIIDGRYAPGARITELGIAAEFSSSRTPVREAMRQLMADGLVLFKPNSGTVVRQWTPDQVHEIFELRVLLESEIAAHGARRISGAEIDELLRLQDDIETGGTDVSGENTARVGRLNREFHRVIAQASRHERLVSMLANAIEVPIVQQTFRRYTARRWRGWIVVFDFAGPRWSDRESDPCRYRRHDFERENLGAQAQRRKRRKTGPQLGRPVSA